MSQKTLKLTGEEFSFFLILWSLCIVSSFLAVPDTFHLFQDIGIENTAFSKALKFEYTYKSLIHDNLISSVFVLPFLLYFGFLIRRHIPVEKIIHPTTFSRNNLILGMIAGLTIIFFMSVFNIYVFHFLPELKTIIEKIQPRPFYGFLASFDNVLYEETLIRFFFTSLLLLLFKRLKQFGCWLAIILSSVIFFAICFPISTLLFGINIFALPKLVIIGIIILGSLEGVIFGWFYWKKGFGLAVLIHFLVEIIGLVIFLIIALPSSTTLM